MTGGFTGTGSMGTVDKPMGLVGGALKMSGMLSKRKRKTGVVPVAKKVAEAILEGGENPKDFIDRMRLEKSFDFWNATRNEAYAHVSDGSFSDYTRKPYRTEKDLAEGYASTYEAEGYTGEINCRATWLRGPQQGQEFRFKMIFEDGRLLKINVDE